jgi:hypothetical protein
MATKGAADNPTVVPDKTDTSDYRDDGYLYKDGDTAIKEDRNNINSGLSDELDEHMDYVPSLISIKILTATRTRRARI